jgi:hypothetical protein
MLSSKTLKTKQLGDWFVVRGRNTFLPSNVSEFYSPPQYKGFSHIGRHIVKQNTAWVIDLVLL